MLAIGSFTEPERVADLARSKTTVDPHSDEIKQVLLATGTAWGVYPREVAYVNERVKAYRRDFSMDNASDKVSLDQVIQLETLIQRYMTWAAETQDYWGEPVNEKLTSDTVKSLSGELRAVKASLGIDKVTREKNQGTESFLARWNDLLKRAKEFGVMRNEQFDKALETFQELKAKLVLHDHSTDEERKMLGCRMEDIILWIREEAIPLFDAIDEEFRAGGTEKWPEGQRQWISRFS